MHERLPPPSRTRIYYWWSTGPYCTVRVTALAGRRRLRACVQLSWPGVTIVPQKRCRDDKYRQTLISIYSTVPSTSRWRESNNIRVQTAGLCGVLASPGTSRATRQPDVSPIFQAMLPTIRINLGPTEGRDGIICKKGLFLRLVHALIRNLSPALGTKWRVVPGLA